MSELPTGTVTFLFTDIEGSTKLLHELGDEPYGAALAEHRRVLRESFVRHGGVEVDTEGDAFFVAFSDAAEAIVAARDAQGALAAGPIRVRMGLHTGTPHVTAQGYVGVDVHKGARIAASSHGGQVVLSKETRTLLGERFDLLDLGEHRVKDFAGPVWIYQLGDERFPPFKTISNTNLPRPASSFVGREREVAEIRSHLVDGTRFLTLTGPGGTGKTRLAIEAASELVPSFRNGVFWVGLADIRDAALVPDTIGHTIGATDGLTEHIGEREMLLVVDNVEQVVAAAPELAVLVERCPNLRLLVTSRELLRVRGEKEYGVPPLADREAVALFCDRANLAPDETIAGLCRRLDDLPLAVELAAARTNVLTPAQILDRLSNRLDLLRGGRDTEARQATLRATIEWSHDLLSPDEQALFARLAVFRGSFSLDAAEHVCDADVEVLSSLVDKSLLRRRDGRFVMLETIREFATERLDGSSQADELRRRHAEFFLALAEETNPSRGETAEAGSAARLDRLEAEHDNLRAALDWFGETREAEREQRLAGALVRFWQVRGHYAEARRRLAHAIAADERPTADRAWALFGAGVVAADDDEATRSFEQALELFDSLGDALGTARVRMNFGTLAMNAGEFERGAALFEESAHAFDQLDVELFAVFSTRMLAWAAYEMHDIGRARDLHQEVVRRAREIGATTVEASSLGALGEYAIEEGRLDDALEFLRQSMRIYLELKDPEQIAVALCRFARIMTVSGRAAVGAKLLARAEGLHDEIGQPVQAWLVKFNDGTRSILGGHLGSQGLAAAIPAGRKLSTDDAVALVLDEDQAGFAASLTGDRVQTEP
jgi:predicted ATPase